MRKSVSVVLAAIAAATLPLWAGDQYQLHLAALICAYWIMIAGLNLVVGFTGQLSIGHVGLLAIGAYTFAILAGKSGVDPMFAVAAAGALCGLCDYCSDCRRSDFPAFILRWRRWPSH
jgi:ABC-type branched-subunit amino acid transport system permease subunit